MNQFKFDFRVLFLTLAIQIFNLPYYFRLGNLIQTLFKVNNNKILKFQYFVINFLNLIINNLYNQIGSFFQKFTLFNHFIHKQMKKRTVTFNLTTGQKTVKLFTLHPKKPWVAIVTNYNSFSLWNYQQKILIKSFNCNSLDQTGNVDIKELIFYDKHCLSYQNQSVMTMKNTIIFATNFKIFFYDYITDGIKQINQSQIQKKNIKKICPYSQTKICIGLSDGSLKLYDNKDTIKNSMTTKTIRGYHTKPITHLFTYCQNTNQTPRVISVSGSDGQMACWNLQTTIINPNQPQVFNPSFKFERQGGVKSQQIRCFQYDRQTYKILTLTQSLISIWSTMTGMQIKRIKNQFKFKQIYFFNHFSYGVNSFIGFSEGVTIQIAKLSPSGKMLLTDDINLKNLIKQTHSLAIKHVFNWPNSPTQLFIQTQTGLVTIQINSTYRPIFGFNNSFVTHLSTINSKQFIIKGQNRINPNISGSQARQANFQKDILFNSFYLSIEQQWVYFNLVQIQVENAIHEHRKFKLMKMDPSSLLNLSQGTQSSIDISYDGKSLLLFNKSLHYFQIHTVIQESQTDNLLDINERNNSADFYSKFQLIFKGMCRDIVWHQYKNQFAAICAFDKKFELITFQTQKQKKPIFGKSSKGDKPSQKLTAQVDHWCACIFEFSRKSKRYLLVQKSKPIKTQLFRILNLGTIYGYSSQQKSSMQTIECFSQDPNLLKDIQGVGFFPSKIYVSFCQTYQIFVYDSYFVVLKLQQNGQIGYHATVHQKIMQGMFWQKFFIFSTKNQLYFLQLRYAGKNLIKIADASPLMNVQKNKAAFQSDYIDDLQSQVGMMPQGQLQFLTIVNCHLVLVNQNEKVELLSLKINPYIQFCIYVVCGGSDKIAQIYKRSSQQIKKLMKQTLEQYGMSTPNVGTLSSQILF